MKKLLVFLLTLSLTFSFAACGDDNDNDAADNGNNAAVEDSNENAAADDAENKDNNNKNDNDDEKEIDKSIDAAADYLGLKNGKDASYETIGAKAGKKYNDGKVELYLFDEDSGEYEKVKKGESSIKAAAHNDGLVLVFGNDEDKDEDLIKKFKEIDFK